MAEIDRTLSKIGLEEQEIKAYLALLDLGEITATKIAERTGLGRVHIYQIVNRLIEKGFVSYVIKNNVKFFSAASPQTFLRDVAKLHEEIKEILPLLEARKNNNISDTKVEIYRGREGVNTILKTILRDGKPYYFLGGIEESCRVFELESRIFVKRAEKMKLNGSILARKKDSFFVGKNEDFRYLPNNVILPSTTWTWGTKTGIFVWQEPYYGVLIESSIISNSNLATFNFLFEAAIKPSRDDINKRLLE